MPELLFQGKPVREWTRFQYDKYRRPADKPNIVLLFTDEQRYDTIHALGYRWMKTPALDRLCEEGTAYVNAYSPNPVCVPARHNLLTGLPARYHGMYDNISRVIPRSIPRLPQILADAGYYTAAIGKMHFQPARTAHGFHTMQLMEEIPPCWYEDEYLAYLRAHGYGHIRNIHGVRNLLYWQPQRSLVPERHHGTTWVGDRCVEFIRANAWRPFFLWAGWIAPHPPLNVPGRWAELYRDAELPEPYPRCDNPHRILRQQCGLDHETPEKVRRLRELYYGAVSHVDHQIGRILETLDECGLADNTLVIFASDHGEMLGDLGGWNKSMPNDPACRVPLILRMPGRVQAGARESVFADLNDLLPTILDAAGVEYPSDAGLELPGESLLTPADRRRKDRTVQYAEFQSGYARWVMIRDSRWKFVHWYDGREQLFDMVADPQERCDLLADGTAAGTPEIATTRQRLRSVLLNYESRWGLEGHVRDGDFVVFPEPPNTWPVEGPGLNWQFQTHWYALPPAEQRRMRSEAEEVRVATAREPTVDLSKLNLDYYLSAGGDPTLVAQVRGEGGRKTRNARRGKARRKKS